MADRWKPGPKTAWLQKLTSYYYARMFRHYQPDMTTRETTSLSENLTTHVDNTRKSTYVWLPIRWENGVPKIDWYDTWKIEDFL